MMGLANRAVSSEQLADAVYAYAREMVRFCSSAAMKAMKAQVYKLPFETLAESVRAANQFMAVMNSSEGFREGTRSRSEKRRVGQEGSVSVDLGGLRIFKEKNDVYVSII